MVSDGQHEADSGEREGIITDGREGQKRAPSRDQDPGYHDWRDRSPPRRSRQDAGCGTSRDAVSGA